MNLDASTHTLRLCWASGVNALISHKTHRIHRLLVFSNNAGLESTEFASRFALAGLPDGSDFVKTIVRFIRGIREISGQKKQLRCTMTKTITSLPNG